MGYFHRYFVLILASLITTNCFAAQYKEWRVISPSGLEGQVFSSMGAACSAGIAKKESNVHSTYPGEYEHRGGESSGPYFWGGSEAYCGHEYKGGSCNNWCTFWPYSGATVVGSNAGECPAGQKWDDTIHGCITDPKNNGEDDNNTCYPINIATGNKFYKVTDFKQSGPFPIEITRYYNSSTGRWAFNYSQVYERFYPAAGGSVLYYYYDAQGRSETWDFVSGWTTGSKTVAVHGDFTVWRRDSVVERFERSVTGSTGQFVTGRLASLTNSGGIKQVLSYDGNTVTVTKNDTHVVIEKNTKGNPIKVTLPDGDYITYQYENASQSSLNRLVRVIYPGINGDESYELLYHYENEAYPKHITKVTDSLQRTISIVEYDEHGRAVVSGQGGGINRTEVEYGEGKTRKITNALGKSTTAHVEVLEGRYLKTRVEGHASTNCLGADTLYSYDENGYVSSKTDRNGNVTNYVRDSAGDELSRTEGYGTPVQRTITTGWSYNGSQKLLSKVSEPGLITEYSYDNDDLLVKTSISNPQNSNEKKEWNYSYNALKLLESVDGPRTDVPDITRFEYDVSGNLYKVINPLGHETRFENYTGTGSPSKVTDQNGVVSLIEYNWKGLATEIRVLSENAEILTSIDYEPYGKVKKITQPDGSNLSYEYDEAERLVAVSNNLGERLEYSLDLAGNRIAEEIKDSSDNLVKKQSRVFDELSRLIESISAGNHSAFFTYDHNSNLTSFVDSNGRQTNNAFDALNRLISTTDANLGVTRFEYDGQDKLVTVTDARGLVTSYGYNFAGDQIQVRSPDTGETNFEYDEAGNIIKRTEASGVVSQYGYDELNRLTAIIYPASPEERITYSYDSDSSCSYGKSRLALFTDFSGQTNYKYDARGNITFKTYEIDGHAYQIGYQYDHANN